MLDSILEATQSHNVNKNGENILNSAKTVSTADTNDDEPGTTGRTVILMRNFDKILEPDVGFCDKT